MPYINNIDLPSGKIIKTTLIFNIVLELILLIVNTIFLTLIKYVDLTLIQPLMQQWNQKLWALKQYFVKIVL